MTTTEGFVMQILHIFLAVRQRRRIVNIRFAHQFRFFVIIPLRAFARVRNVNFAIFTSFPLFDRTQGRFNNTSFGFGRTIVGQCKENIVNNAKNGRLQIGPFQESF